MDMKQKTLVWAFFITICTAVAVLWLFRFIAPEIEHSSDSTIHPDRRRADHQATNDRLLLPPRQKHNVGAPLTTDNGIKDPVDDRARLNDGTARDVNAPESEQAYIDRLRRLAVDEPKNALTLAQQGEERFPHGEFSEERQAIAINVLVRLDRIGEARSRTRAFIRRYPTGRFTRQVRGLTGVHPRPAGPNREWEW